MLYRADEGISEETLLLLSDGDLKELGFKMGERRQILQHIERINASSVRPDDSFNVLAPIQEPMEVSATSSLSDTSSTFVSSIRSSTPITAHCNLRKFKVTQGIRFSI